MLPTPAQPGPSRLARGLRLRVRAALFDLITGRSGTWLAVALLTAAWRLFDLAGRPDRALHLAMLTHRLSLRLQPGPAPTGAQHRIEERFRRAVTTGAFTRLAAPAPGVDHSAELAWRALVLKAPRQDAPGRVAERGVLLLTFTHLFGELARLVDISRLSRVYTLVLEPSWSGYAHAEILQFAESSDTPVFVQATEPRDYALLERFHPRLVPLPFGASNWVDPEVFMPPADAERVFDAGCIGFWGAVKRHHVLFRALRRLDDAGYRVALIGGAWQGTKEEIAALARTYGVLDRLTFFEQLTPTQVSEVIGRCRVNLLLSRKEGSNRGLFEGMFAGTPALLLAENLGVRQDYVNPRTGRIVPEGDLVEALRWFRTGWSAFTPRDWALEHLSPEATTRDLNAHLRRRAEADGEPWTIECVPKTNRPEVMYLRPEDRDRLPPVAHVLGSFVRQGVGVPWRL